MFTFPNHEGQEDEMEECELKLHENEETGTWRVLKEWNSGNGRIPGRHRKMSILRITDTNPWIRTREHSVNLL